MKIAHARAKVFAVSPKSPKGTRHEVGVDLPSDETGWFSGGLGRRIVLELSGDAFETTGEPAKLKVDGVILGFE